MTPADIAAYTALNLRPGADWGDVTASYRHLVKLYHPDHNPLLGSHEQRRLLEINAAYEHLRSVHSRIVPENGRVVLEAAPAPARREAWERVWDARTWSTWIPGVTNATAVKGMSDRRATVWGLWGGRKVTAVIVFCGLTPCRRIAARVLELRVGKEHVRLSAPPSIAFDFGDHRTVCTVRLPEDAPVALFQGVELLMSMALEQLLAGPDAFAQAA